MSIRLLALDLDGTLVADHHTIPPRTRAAINAASNHGVAVTIATGREFAVTQKFVDTLNLTTPIICCQGAIIHDPVANQPLASETISLPLTYQLIDLARLHRLTLNLYLDDGGVYTESATPLSRAFFDHVGVAMAEVDDLKHAVNVAPAKGVIFHPADSAGAVVTELQAALGPNLAVYRSLDRLIEITAPNISKGSALASLAGYLDIPQAEVMAIGDHDNDIEMIAWAGVGVAMGNASPGAKAVADVVAPPIEEEGAAWAIEQFVLKRK